MREEEVMQEANGEIIAGVEEKDRAFGRTLKRSQSQFDHSPVHFDADRLDGLAAAAAAGASLAVGPCRRGKWSLCAESLVVMYSPLKLIRDRNLIRCHLSFRT
jgi:hypothetical protein